MSSSTPPTFYFGYGSNLWLHQMSTRCPSSTYQGIARLDNYKWIINERGYANIVKVSPSSSTTQTQTTPSPAPTSRSSSSSSSSTPDTTPHVYGLLFHLTTHDERHLDKNEGVPLAYTKEYLPATFWSATSPASKIDITTPPSETDKRVLVYIDRKRVTPGRPREEYVYRMNRGIEDAVACGVPEEYVSGVIRGFIREYYGGKEEGVMGEYAKRQAAEFRDESGVIE